MCNDNKYISIYIINHSFVFLLCNGLLVVNYLTLKDKLRNALEEYEEPIIMEDEQYN